MRKPIAALAVAAALAVGAVDAQAQDRLVIAGRDAENLRVQLGDLSERVILCECGAESAAQQVPSMPPDKLVGLYLTADAFVLSSLLEGFSSAIIEAMAAGLPLVVTDVPGIRGVVADNREGLLVPPRSPAALAAAMRRMVEDAELRARLSSAARQTAARYNWPTVVGEYENLYRELNTSRSRP
jgi:glycosyltransferase involved in cell wall biosynthesis